MFSLQHSRSGRCFRCNIIASADAIVAIKVAVLFVQALVGPHGGGRGGQLLALFGRRFHTNAAKPIRRGFQNPTNPAVPGIRGWRRYRIVTIVDASCLRGRLVERVGRRGAGRRMGGVGLLLGAFPPNVNELWQAAFRRHDSKRALFSSTIPLTPELANSQKCDGCASDVCGLNTDGWMDGFGFMMCGTNRKIPFNSNMFNASYSPPTQ